MFSYAMQFNQDLDNWDTSNCMSMDSMFEGAHEFNGNITTWDVSVVTKMDTMFSQAYVFNRDISNWNTYRNTKCTQMFYEARAFNQPLPQVTGKWCTSNVDNMESMFQGAVLFNRDISSWNVSKVNDMSQMFANATVFNSPLNSWDVRKVTDMNQMFYKANSFNQEIYAWQITGIITDMTYFMNGPMSYNPTYLDHIYNTWSTLPVSSGIRIDFTTVNFTSAGLAGKNSLIASHGWDIYDGGMI